MNRSSTIVRLFVIFVLLPSLLSTSPAFAVEQASVGQSGRIYYTELQEDNGCSCLGYHAHRAIMNLLQLFSIGQLEMIATSTFRFPSQLENTAFIHYTQLNVEDIYGDIFKPPKM